VRESSACRSLRAHLSRRRGEETNAAGLFGRNFGAQAAHDQPVYCHLCALSAAAVRLQVESPSASRFDHGSLDLDRIEKKKKHEEQQELTEARERYLV
jgi:hypothetical protein